MNLTNLSKQDLLELQYLTGRTAILFLLSLLTLTIRSLEIGVGLTTILTHQVLTI